MHEVKLHKRKQLWVNIVDVCLKTSHMRQSIALRLSVGYHDHSFILVNPDTLQVRILLCDTAQPLARSAADLQHSRAFSSSQASISSAGNSSPISPITIS